MHVLGNPRGPQVGRAGSVHCLIPGICSKRKPRKDKRPAGLMHVICVSYVLRSGCMFANVCPFDKHASHAPARSRKLDIPRSLAPWEMRVQGPHREIMSCVRFSTARPHGAVDGGGHGCPGCPALQLDQEKTGKLIAPTVGGHYATSAYQLGPGWLR